MSRVGISNNVTQPDARCMSCKRWKSASKRGFFDFAESSWNMPINVSFEQPED